MLRQGCGKCGVSPLKHRCNAVVQMQVGDPGGVKGVSPAKVRGPTASHSSSQASHSSLGIPNASECSGRHVAMVDVRLDVVLSV